MLRVFEHIKKGAAEAAVPLERPIEVHACCFDFVAFCKADITRPPKELSHAHAHMCRRPRFLDT